jgi:hypothetical protein
MRQNKLYDKMSNRTDVWLTRTVNLATLVTGPVVFWAILALRYACVFTLHQAPRQKVLLLIAEVETENRECRLFSRGVAYLAPAAKVGSSNWIFRPSSFSLFVLGLCHSSGSRFSSQSGLMFEWHRCKHMLISGGEPRFPACFKMRSRHFRLLPRTSSGEGRPR